jgi:ubiquinone/menaquinone biosynthesis C-methylase UbiE
MTFTDAKHRFSHRVADYIRYRPGYPSALLDVLAKECGWRPGQVIADIGSGTGLLSKLFLDHGNRVYGVEPNTEMRAGGEEFLRGYADFSSVDGSAEATTLGESSVDLVTAGQAFHWFDAPRARREFLRILKPRGFVVVAWNHRRISESRFGQEYEDLLVRYGTDYARVKEAYPETAAMQSFFGDAKLQARELPNFQEFDFHGLTGRLRSSSYAPEVGHANYAPMMNRLQELFDANQVRGSVRMTYTTQIYFGQLAALRNSG